MILNRRNNVISEFKTLPGNTQCLHIRKHRLAGFFVRLLSPVLLPHRHLCHLPTSILIALFSGWSPGCGRFIAFWKWEELPPGTYRVDIYLNNGYMARVMSHLIRATVNKGLFPAWQRATRQYGAEYGFCRRYESAADDACVPLTTMVQDATAHLDLVSSDWTWRSLRHLWVIARVLYSSWVMGSRY